MVFNGGSLKPFAISALAVVFSLVFVSCSTPSGREAVARPVIEAASTPGVPTPAPTPSPVVQTETAVPTPTKIPTRTPTAIPTHTATPTSLACWDEGFQVIQDSLRNDLLPLPLEYTVYLPPCYQQQTERRYPVLYLIHGQNYNHDQWDRLGAEDSAAALISAGEIPPFILVLPRDRSWAQPTEDRFGQVLVESLIPYIDGHYRTYPDREHRAVGGLSRGAGWAVHLGLSHWKLFGAIGAHSLPVFWTDTYHIREWLDAIPTESLPRIYMDIGEKDRPAILNSAMWFQGLLTEKGIPHEWHLFTGYHEEAYWAAHVEQYIRWYTREWPAEN